MTCISKNSLFLQILLQDHYFFFFITYKGSVFLKIFLTYKLLEIHPILCLKNRSKYRKIAVKTNSSGMELCSMYDTNNV